MDIRHDNTTRKAVRTTRPNPDTECALTPAARFILARVDVSPSLAATIAGLAHLGCRT